MKCGEADHLDLEMTIVTIMIRGENRGGGRVESWHGGGGVPGPGGSSLSGGAGSAVRGRQGGRGGSGGDAAQAWGTSHPRGRPGCEEWRETIVYIQYYKIQVVVMFQFQNKLVKIKLN